MEQQKDTYGILYAYVFGKADEGLLEDWVSGIVQGERYDFASGLLGAGWLICYLTEEGYIEGDADEILEDIDDNLYKMTIQEVLRPEIDNRALLHYLTYYQQRLLYKSKAHFYRRFTHFECIKLLLERMNTCLSMNDSAMVKKPAMLIDILLKYTFLIKIGITEKLVEEALYRMTERLISSLEEDGEVQHHEDDLAKFYIAVKQYGHIHWENRLHALLDKLPEDAAERCGWVALARREGIKQKDIMEEVINRRNGAGFLFLCLTNMKIVEHETS